ncbi:DUF6879 family protein [Streptomyces sp. NPDC048680]|uniref:DUF6879 family protein n=1 Tax=Streptomyces sp. NPDC048680 TaxID=3155492 RepID=UPI0034189CCC
MQDTERSAVHLEMRDTYFDNERFAAWRGGERVNWEDRDAWWRGYHGLVAQAVDRGVVIRRLRVASEPVSEYIRWERYVTRANVEAAEQVRRLPRIHHFAGDGALVEDESSTEPRLLKCLADSFETLWGHGIPHDEFHV